MPFVHDPVDLGYQDILCETTEKGRKYVTPQGKQYPSITTILGKVMSDGWVEEWKAAVGEEAADRVRRVAAQRGERVHSLVESFLDNREIDLRREMPNVSAAFKSIRPVLEQHVNRIRLQEKPLYSDFLKAAGRVDLVAEYDGVLSIIDIKTSSKVKMADDIHNYFMQETAYAIMFEERTQIPVEQIVTVMAVDFSSPLVFIEKRDNWSNSLANVIAEYRTRFGANDTY
jgi:ATP-dependent exoDNAse (exonuclease V) beta subunit